MAVVLYGREHSVAKTVNQVLQVFVCREPQLENSFYIINAVSVFVCTSPNYEKDGLVLVVADGEDNTQIQSALIQLVSKKVNRTSGLSVGDHQTMLRTLRGLTNKLTKALTEVDFDVQESMILSRPETFGSGVPLPLEMFGMNSDEVDSADEY